MISRTVEHTHGQLDTHTRTVGHTYGQLDTKTRTEGHKRTHGQKNTHMDTDRGTHTFGFKSLITPLACDASAIIFVA